MSKPGRTNDREPLNQTAGTAAATGDTPNSGDLLAREPTHEEIARRAYRLFEERGGEPGHELEDWFRAEREPGEAQGDGRHTDGNRHR